MGAPVDIAGRTVLAVPGSGSPAVAEARHNLDFAAVAGLVVVDSRSLGCSGSVVVAAVRHSQAGSCLAPGSLGGS